MRMAPCSAAADSAQLRVEVQGLFRNPNPNASVLSEYATQLFVLGGLYGLQHRISKFGWASIG